MTFIELVIAMAITAVIVAGISAAIAQVFKMNSRNTSHMVTIRQVQSAGYWVSRDAQMARNISDTSHSPSLTVLALDWREWDGTAISVTYWLSGTTPNLALNRTYKTNNVIQSSSIISHNIASSSDCSVIYPVNGKLVFTITATIGNEHETRIYEVKPRPGN
jgi:type II secretory pathway component PulJ